MPSRTILVKFSGQNLPHYVSFLHVRFPVLPYIPRVRLCFACLRYEYISADCKGAPRCPRCGNSRHDSPRDCPRANLPQICCNCQQKHLSFSSSYPLYVKQKHIYAMAALRIFLTWMPVLSWVMLDLRIPYPPPLTRHLHHLLTRFQLSPITLPPHSHT